MAEIVIFPRRILWDDPGFYRKMSEGEALEKARRMKMEVLEIIDDIHSIHIIADLSC